jgi:hypothetical protein
MDTLTGLKLKEKLMIENSTLRVGGNTLKVWIGDSLNNIGEFFTKKGTNMVVNNKPKMVTNPTAKLINPFTLMISFTVDTNQKYQVILQGDYKGKYKECENGEINLTENEIFMLINSSHPLWFKKE